MADDKMPSQRFALYNQAIKSIKSREFSISFPSEEVPVHAQDFETELIKLAAWLELQFDEYEKLQFISTEISKGNMLDEVLDRIFEVFKSVIPYDRIGCALLSEDNKKVVSRWTKTSYEQKVKINAGFSAPLAGSSLEPILETRKPRILNDLKLYLAQHPKSASTKLIVAEGIQSSLTCPLIAEDKPIGFLFFSSSQKNAYRDIHQQVFIHIARQISVLIEKSQLYQRIFMLNQKLMDAMTQLKQQSCRDALTGIFHRGAIMEFMQNSLKESRRKSHPVCVIMMDLDHFKQVNDTYGHVAGDEVIQRAAQTIKSHLRDYDNVGRYGGEEFLIVLGDTNIDDGQEVAERIKRGIGDLAFQFEESHFSITISAGIVCSDICEDLTEEQLIILADKALYQAKEQGRNRIVCHQ